MFTVYHGSIKKPLKTCIWHTLHLKRPNMFLNFFHPHFRIMGAFTPQYFSHKGSWELSSWELFSSHELVDRVHTGISSWGRIRQMKPLTSLLLLLLWVYWRAANNFTAYTATRSPRPEVPGVGGLQPKAFRVNRQNTDTSSSIHRSHVLFCVAVS